MIGTPSERIREQAQREAGGNEKTPGFDPAAAPLETDAEASGYAVSDSQLEGPRQFRNASSYGDAMRPMEGASKKAPERMLPLFIIAGFIAAAMAVIILAAALGM